MAEYVVPVTTTGSNGSATGTANTSIPVNGPIAHIHIDYHASAPSSTVVTVAEVGGAARTVLTAPASATDVLFNPRLAAHSTVGAAETSKTEWFVIPNRYLSVTVTLSNALTNCVVVRIITID